MITIIHDDGTELTAYESQTCLECNGEYVLYQVYMSFDVNNYDAAYVECPHCESETIVSTY